jgi:uncharacterized protein YydD (DUF2326 family)
MDRIKIQIQFRKAIWVCPKCSQEDYEDLNVNGGNKYEHNCSNCGTWSNNFRVYNDTLDFSPEEYNKIKPEDIIIKKQEKFNNHLNILKNPIPYVDPTPEEIQKEIDIKQEQISSLTVKKISTQSKLDEIKLKETKKSE